MKKSIYYGLIALATLTVLRFRPVLSLGTCIDYDGNGHIEKSTDGVQEPYTYISYYGIAEKGQKVITLDIFNPLNNYCDDTILVMDYNTNTKKISIR